jgi:O-phospho-L-seryl-tRNASec:L-selenocysteinyl-tRNA synthase
VSGRAIKEVGAYRFVGYGAHCDAYPSAYLNVAAAIGFRESEMLTFLQRLDLSLREYKTKISVQLEAPTLLH